MVVRPVEDPEKYFGPIEANLDRSAWRCSSMVVEANARLLQSLKWAVPSPELTWAHGGRFLSERFAPMDDEEREECLEAAQAAQAVLRPSAQLYHSYHAYKAAQSLGAHGDDRQICCLPRHIQG